MGSAIHIDVSSLTNGSWVVHVECSCFPQVLAKFHKASNARDQDEVSSDLARMMFQDIMPHLRVKSIISFYF